MAKRLISAALGAALLLAAAPASAVTNGGFEDATITPLSGITAGGLGNFTSGWDGWNNNGLQVDITDASPGTDPFVAGGNHMAHIVSAGLNDGLFQFDFFQSLSADFYVVSGAAQLGAYSSYAGVGTVSTTATGVWQHLTLNIAGGANELVLYTFGGASEFYVDNIVSGSYNPDQPSSSVTTFSGGVPEPGAWAMMLLGLGVSGLALRRRSRAALATSPCA